MRIPLNPRDPALHAFLTDPIDTLYALREREIDRIEQSRSALLYKYDEAFRRGDTREQHRLMGLLQEDTNRSLAASLRQQPAKKTKSSSRNARETCGATPKSAAPGLPKQGGR